MAAETIDMAAVDTETDDAADPDLEAATEAAGGATETDLAPDLGVETEAADETDTKHSHADSSQFLANLENLQTTARFLSTLVPKTVLLSLP